MNDILPCVDDLLELIWQSRRNNAGITCAADYMYHEELGSPVFYDNWVARDINGTALENVFVDEEDNSKNYLHHRLGIHDDPPALGMRARPCLPPVLPPSPPSSSARPSRSSPARLAPRPRSCTAPPSTSPPSRASGSTTRPPARASAWRTAKYHLWQTDEVDRVRFKPGA
ncbi:hypothetical protein NUW54_g9712 [Trametes sanguinea]|uniref:Uncharacterized protein n=1 Tax=Trametes sanguinea TaxID=158606 RepID=A0ACC1P407_9APHY|nr:hypothetical protein NUW54_g9712 [Trametes sanguinea]